MSRPIGAGALEAAATHCRLTTARCVALGSLAGALLFYLTGPAGLAGDRLFPSSSGAERPSSSGADRRPGRPLSELLQNSTLESLGETGAFYTDQSACDVSRWRMSESAEFLSSLKWGLCSSVNADAVLTSERAKAGEVKEGDTVFVDSKGLSDFVTKVLPALKVDVVVLTEHNVKWEPDDYEPLLTHPRVIHVFTQNPWKVHANMSGIPQGIGQVMEGPSAIKAYRKEFQRLNSNPSIKSKNLFLSYIKKGGTRSHRNKIPSGPKLKYPKYAAKMAKHHYVISPDGDRPDCKRNWEAIGLGTVPITQLNPLLYSFMEPLGVIFDHQGSWQVEDLEKELNETSDKGGRPIPRETDRRAVFEIFWMDRMEHTVERELNWGTTI